MQKPNLVNGLKNTIIKTAVGMTAACTIAGGAYSLGLQASSPTATESKIATPISFDTVGQTSHKKIKSSDVSNAKGISIDKVLEQAKKKDPVGYDKRLTILKSSPELTEFLVSQAGSTEAGGIEGLAAVLTQDQVQSFVRDLRGKSLTVSRDGSGEQAVSLESSSAPSAGIIRSSFGTTAPSVRTAGWNGPTCWQGWLAAGAYGAATGAICGAVGFFSAGIGWLSCAGFGALATGINWNNACN